MAAHLARDGHRVRLWNRSSERISTLAEQKTITATGVIDGCFAVDVVTGDLNEALRDAEIVLVATPATAHEGLAKGIARLVRDDTVVVLNPGRTLGAFEFQRQLRSSGAVGWPLVAETQTIIYTCRAIGPTTVDVLALKSNVLISTVDPADTLLVLSRLPTCLRQHLIPARSHLETSLGNVGMVLHCLPMLLNAGWVENQVASFKYYYSGITPTIATLLEHLDAERVDVCASLGVVVPSTREWLYQVYGVASPDLFHAIAANEAYATIDAPATLWHRYLLEDVPFGLVPTEDLGLSLGVPTPTITLTIEMASALLNTNFRAVGRRASPFLEFRDRRLATDAG
jgi:opine dehydrogenase